MPRYSKIERNRLAGDRNSRRRLQFGVIVGEGPTREYSRQSNAHCCGQGPDSYGSLATLSQWHARLSVRFASCLFTERPTKKSAKEIPPTLSRIIGPHFRGFDNKGTRPKLHGFIYQLLFILLRTTVKTFILLIQLNSTFKSSLDWFRHSESRFFTSIIIHLVLVFVFVFFVIWFSGFIEKKTLQLVLSNLNGSV